MPIDYTGSGPRTRRSLAADLRELGLRAGETLLIHPSLSSLGYVSGGALTVVLSFLDVLGPEGTLVVPSQTATNRDPATWSPAPPASWWPEIRASLPGFDPARSASVGVSVITEQVRTWPGAVRSAHPQTSFAALGPRAADLMGRHALDCHLGEESPLAALEAIGARALLLGVGFDRATAFHLAEYRMPEPARRTYACAVRTDDGDQWLEYEDVILDDRDFGRLGADFERDCGAVRTGTVGSATGKLFAVTDAVAYAGKWFSRHREHGAVVR